MCSQLRILTHFYQGIVQQFLVLLTTSSDESLRFLSFRLDFNEHYKAREPRLRVSLGTRGRRSSHTWSSRSSQGAADDVRCTARHEIPIDVLQDLHAAGVLPFCPRVRHVSAEQRAGEATRVSHVGVECICKSLSQVGWLPCSHLSLKVFIAKRYHNLLRLLKLSMLYFIFVTLKNPFLLEKIRVIAYSLVKMVTSLLFF